MSSASSFLSPVRVVSLKQGGMTYLIFILWFRLYHKLCLLLLLLLLFLHLLLCGVVVAVHVTVAVAVALLLFMSLLLLLPGSFATQVAGSTWDEIKLEAEAEKRKLNAQGGGGSGSSAEGDTDLNMLGFEIADLPVPLRGFAGGYESICACVCVNDVSMCVLTWLQCVHVSVVAPT